MYRQGLGDCFLLTVRDGETSEVGFVPRPGAVCHVLLDCGVLLGTKEAAAKMGAVVADIIHETAGKLDVLIATHEHWDHVSGFVQAPDGFDRLEVGQVWLSWAEDPTNALARQLKGETAAAVQTLCAAAQHLGLAEQTQLADGLLGLLAFHGIDDSGLGAASTKRTTGSALDYVRHRAAAGPRYHRPGDQLLLPGIAGVRVYVLGPPENAQRLRKSLPGAAHETYVTGQATALDGMTALVAAIGRSAGVSLLGAAQEEVWDRSTPFDPGQALALEDTQGVAFFADTYWAAGAEWQRIDHDWLGAAAELALQLDSATNSTSLVLAIELVATGQVLLFPGDAQVGNWLSWDDLPGWQQDGQTVTAAELLRRTVVYKVGHHGSHNATMRATGLDRMTNPNLMALVPVDHAMAEHQEWAMPYGPLLDRLRQLSSERVAESDVCLAPGSAWSSLAGAAVWPALPPAFCASPLHLDLTVYG